MIVGYSDKAWEMHAAAGAPGSDRPLDFFGPLGYAKQNRLAQRVVRVLLEVDDDGDYWAWLDDGAWEPCHVAATEEKMTTGFLAGQTGAPGPREEEKVGLGRILRLKVTILEEVHVRSGRSNWSSAQ